MTSLLVSRLKKAAVLAGLYACAGSALAFLHFLFGAISRSVPNASVRLLLSIANVCISGACLAMVPLFYLYLVRYRYWLKGHQATSLAHELKSPLATIIVAGEALIGFSKKTPVDRDQQIAYLTIIQRNVSGLKNFVRDLLSVMSIGSGKFMLVRQPINIPDLVRDVTDDFQLLASSKGVEIRTELSRVPPVMAEAGKIRQVLANLLSNAVKFSEHGSIVVALHHNQRFVTCSVSDQGIGIARSELHRVFDRFFHGKQSVKGSGMGLTIAKGWVEAHGGKIWAESAGLGKGSTIIFILPLMTPPAERPLRGVWEAEVSL